MPLRLVMMGTGPFAVPTFEALCQSAHQVTCLVTRPSVVNKGRGPEPVNPMRQAAERLSIPVYAPQDINSDEARSTLASAAADLFVVCDYGQILKRETLALARLGGVNLHGSLLPKYRGAAPIQWAVWHGDSETGVTVIHMTPQLDGGPILAIRTLAIEPTETAEQLEPRLSRLGVEPVLESLDLLAAWDGSSPIGQVQDQQQASRAPRLKKTDGAIDWTRTARQIQNQIRAVQPWPGAHTFWQRGPGEPLRLAIDRVELMMADPASDEAHPVADPGVIVATAGDRIIVAAGQGLVAIRQVQPAGKRMMSVGEFLRGYPLKAGEKLGGRDLRFEI